MHFYSFFLSFDLYCLLGSMKKRSVENITPLIHILVYGANLHCEGE